MGNFSGKFLDVDVEEKPGHELPELLLAGVVTHRAQAAENTLS